MSRRPIHLGHDAESPLILGAVNKAPAIFVVGTGLFMSIRKDDERWVTGTAVRAGLAGGSLIQIFAKGESIVVTTEPGQPTSDVLPGQAGRISIPPPTPSPAPADTDLKALHKAHEAVLEGAEPASVAAAAETPEPAKATPVKKAAAKKAAAKPKPKP